MKIDIIFGKRNRYYTGYVKSSTCEIKNVNQYEAQYVGKVLHRNNEGKCEGRKREREEEKKRASDAKIQTE